MNKETIKHTYNVITIDGEDYFTIKEFARLTHRTEQSVRLLISHGNRIRKLEARHVSKTVLIPLSELTEYIFTSSGKSRLVYQYDEDGNEKRYYL